jgi:hypothetical protein
MWIIEFRNGGFFQNCKTDRSGPKGSAQRFGSKDEAEAFMDKHQWIYFNGGMAVPGVISEP